MDCEEIRALGFVGVNTTASFKEASEVEAACSLNASAILILNYGKDLQRALECSIALDQCAKAAPNIVILAMPDEEPPESGEADTRSLKIFLESGADDVITLYGTEDLTDVRLQEAILRTEVMAQKASAMINQEVDVVKKQMAKTLQVAWKRFMWDLPGKVLDNIPHKDDNLNERVEEKVGVGEYTIVDQIPAAAGALRALLKANHPSFGTCALKVIPKNSIKNVCQLRSVDSELCIMRNLTSHPNIARAHETLHGENNIVLVMDNFGDLNLHGFIVKKLKHSAGDILPSDLVARFCEQEAAGVAHLHSFLICHRDIKPTSFIVSNDGVRLRLSDFTLAVMACGAEQKFLHCCGSLPFAAPEVLRVQQGPKAGAVGYNGFAADVWSLAVNFIELGHGLYILERLLGWVPQPPPDSLQRMCDLEGFPEIWRAGPKMDNHVVRRTVEGMFTLRPEQRWTMGRVIGSEGLGLQEAHGCSDPNCWHGSASRRPQANSLLVSGHHAGAPHL